MADRLFYERVQNRKQTREIIIDRDFMKFLKEKAWFISMYTDPTRQIDVFTRANKKGKLQYVGRLYNVLAQYYGKEFVSFNSEDINDFRKRNIVLQ